MKIGKFLIDIGCLDQVAAVGITGDFACIFVQFNRGFESVKSKLLGLESTLSKFSELEKLVWLFKMTGHFVVRFGHGCRIFLDYF